MGVKVGKNCRIATYSFDSEPYLIEIGDHVAIASGTRFITHDGGVWIFRDEIPELDLFGKIKIGNNCLIGYGCIILPKTVIGNNCIIGAGSVVRGIVPDDSVVLGNPGKVIMKTNLYKLLVINQSSRLNTKKLSRQQKKKIIMDNFDKF